ncbi:hypothetical protein PENTCL1PPCAC_28884, partial [Pristionchus entomophagus]
FRMRSLAVLVLLAISSVGGKMTTYNFHNNCNVQVQATFNDEPASVLPINPGGSVSQDRNTGEINDLHVLVSNGVGGLTRVGFYVHYVFMAGARMHYYIDLSKGFDTGVKVAPPLGGPTLICSNSACAGNGNPLNGTAWSEWQWVSPFDITFCP